MTADEMRDLEGSLFQQGVNSDMLIGIAAQSIVRAIQDHAPNGQIIVLAGPGKNGQDGLLAARLMQAAGREVVVFGYRVRDHMGFDGSLQHCDEDEDCDSLRRALPAARVIIDALLGTGRSRKLDHVLATIVRLCNTQRARDSFALAVDVPTGVNCDTGDVDNDTFQADATLCIGCEKRGTALFPGAGYSGAHIVANLGISERMTGHIEVSIPTRSDVAAMLPVRSKNTNKGTFGRLLFIGGSRNFLGAPVLSSSAAYRAGAGLVQIAVPFSVQAAMASRSTEAIFNVLPEEDGHIGREAIGSVTRSIEQASAVIIGPGMGVSESIATLMRSMLDSMATTRFPPTVIDADGLNCLAQISNWWEGPTDLILTPHPGEMARLSGLSVQSIQSDRLGTARTFARKWNKIVVLKGAGTVVAAPSGEVSINSTGGPNLATAGTGDVLSGTIGGLLAQGCSPWRSAVAGVYLHGLAGDLASTKMGDTGTLASDLPDLLPFARLSILDNAEIAR
ncbi:MAG: bifunctional ADP-dependent NAD(P)H-hydrate dehydratase/NAD(P)H-hydrate epimerase [Chloroflexota bacterium]